MKRQTLLLMTALGFIAACADNDGPFERVGEEIDESVEDIQQRGEDPANQLDDAVDEIRDTAEDAADEAEDVFQ